MTPFWLQSLLALVAVGLAVGALVRRWSRPRPTCDRCSPERPTASAHLRPRRLRVLH